MKLNAGQVTLVSLFVLSAALVGCVDDNKNLFDAEKVKEIYQNSFPVQNIDPDMDWKTTRTAALNVTVNEDRGAEYRVRVFDANPLSAASNAKLLAEGYTDADGKLETLMDYPLSLDAVFVMRTDAHNRHLLKYVAIDNGEINTTFGLATPAPTRSTRAAIHNAIETLTPRKTEAEINELVARATVLPPNQALTAGEVYNIPVGTTFRENLHTNGLNGSKAIVIIQGTWAPGRDLQQVEDGIDIYVTDGGEIIIPEKKELRLNATAALTVFKGGSIKGGDDSKIYSTNGTKDCYFYNAGEIKVEELHMDGSNGVFYNCGTMILDKLNFQNEGARLINQGHLIAEKTSEHFTLENGCYAEIEEFNGHLIQGESCAMVVKEYNEKGEWGRTVRLGKNSMLTIKEEAKLAGATFSGPTDGYALIKINEIESLQSFKSSGNIYYEVNEIDDDISTDNWMKPFFDALKNSNGTISKYGESPFILDAGECTGEGNKAPEGDGEDIETSAIKYTYAFEDNYPAAGDYDFNDAVINVTSENEYKDDDKNKLKEIKYKITLAAVGANKQLGAGLRLVGIDKDVIKEIKFDGDKEKFRNTLPNSMFEDATVESKGDEIVIPLFGDAHKVYGLNYADRPFVNTETNNRTDLYTLEISLVLNKAQSRPAITKDNLDFFIAYGQAGSRTEVHLYEFREAKATANGNIHQENLDLAGNLTWAICVPEFDHPLERVKITDAYPDFSKWATTGGHDETYNEWYNNKIENKVFK